MLKSRLFATLALAATPALAQAQPPASTAPAQAQQGPTPPPAFMQAAEAFGHCVSNAMERAPASATPEAAAAQAMAGCSAQRTAIETQFDAWIASPEFPAGGREMARQQFRARLGQAEGQLAAALRQRRAGGQPAN